MDALATPHAYPRRIATGQLAALVASASAALAAHAAAPGAHPLAALGRPTPAPEPGRGTTVDAAA